MIGFPLLWTTIIIIFREVFTIKNERTRSMVQNIHKKKSSLLKNKSLSRNYTFETLHFTAQPSIKHGFSARKICQQISSLLFLIWIFNNCKMSLMLLLHYWNFQIPLKTRGAKILHKVVLYIRFNSGFNHAPSENWILKFSKLVRFR